jgi:homoserine O-acetyltransferase/O-succinyltransferase
MQAATNLKFSAVHSTFPSFLQAIKFANNMSLRRTLLMLLLVTASFLAKAEDPKRHEFVIHNFKTESGVILPEAHIVYGTYGHLNAAHDNAILLPSYYMSNLHGYEWLIKSKKAPAQVLDTSKSFLVTTELFGNGRSSSPSNTPEPSTARAFPS